MTGQQEIRRSGAPRLVVEAVVALEHGFSLRVTGDEDPRLRALVPELVALASIARKAGACLGGGPPVPEEGTPQARLQLVHDLEGGSWRTVTIDDGDGRLSAWLERHPDLAAVVEAWSRRLAR